MLEPIGRILRRVLHPDSATRLRNHDDDPAQPTRSAKTDAGIVGNSTSNERTTGSYPSNADAAGAREYEGSDSAANARRTVPRANPNRTAIARSDSPSPK